jgi:hypothetical protein
MAQPLMYGVWGASLENLFVLEKPCCKDKENWIRIDKIFQMVGVPTNDNWPDFEQLPNAATSTVFHHKSLYLILALFFAFARFA